MTGTISRRQAVAMFAAFGGAIPSIPALAAQDAGATPELATPSGAAGALSHRGITYDVGTNYDNYGPGYISRPDSHRAYFPQELSVIRNDLQCTTVGLYGSDVERLIEGANAAVDAGLHVRVQPRVLNASADQLLPQVAMLAEETERLNAGQTEAVLDIGCELSLFAEGIMPGATVAERLAYFVDHLDELPEINERLNTLLEQLVTEARKSFQGRLTYASGSWEEVDWSSFDIVGVDLYRDKNNQDAYGDLLQAYQQQGKPLWITEFGCCCFEGADELGSGGYDIIDWSTGSPEFKESYTRDEAVQANYISDLLGLYEANGVDGAFAHTFIDPELPHDPDPQRDLDLASFSVVKTYADGSDHPYDETGYWEPKEAFTVIASRYGAGESQPVATPLPAD